MNSNDFLDILRSSGYLVDVVIPDGKIHRMAHKDKPYSISGWYIFYNGRHPVAIAGDWRTGEKRIFKSYDYAKLAPEDQRRIRKRWRELAKQRQEEEKRVHREAAQKAIQIWERAHPVAETFPYLMKKQVQSHELRFHKGKAIVPVRDILTNKLISIQFIDENGDKRFLSGGKIRGGYYLIGKSNSNLLYLCEGFATAATIHEVTGCGAAIAFNSSNLTKVASGLSKRNPGLNLIIAADNDRFNEINIGVNKARKAAESVGCQYVVPEFLEDHDGTDFNDLLIVAGRNEVSRQLTNSTLNYAQGHLSNGITLIKNWLSGEVALTKFEVLDTLSNMSRMDSDPFRKAVSDKLEIRTSTLDEELSQRRKSDEVSKSDTLGFEKMEPWPNPVHGEDLIKEIIQLIEDVVKVEDGYSFIIALWVIHSWIFDLFEVSPYLAINSPTKRCGKTRLVSLVQSLTQRPILANNITAASVFRTVEAYRPTLLIDEADRFLRINEELVGILNSGHTKSAAFVIRLEKEGEKYFPKKYSTWCPKIIAGIGTLPDTLSDRAIEIPMRRKTTEEKIKSIRLSKLPKQLKPLREKILRWTQDNKNLIETAVPHVPESSNDRAVDNWMPLLQIAKVLGGKWSDEACRMFGKCANGEEPDDGVSIVLLTDIKQIFAAINTDRISTSDLIEKLCHLEERPWSTYNRGKEISGRQVAQKLKLFKITSTTIRFEDGSRKGYYTQDFADVFKRYIHENKNSLSVTSVTSLKNMDLFNERKGNTSEIVTDKKVHNLVSNNKITGVTDKAGEFGNEHSIEDKTNNGRIREWSTTNFNGDAPYDKVV